ncbi:aldo/keto reductase family protein [Rhizoctonia solani]|uniref:Aldo/keto reductase family protein n=1 Tax=Rhizoctonia solani TaxID=456999 RepID=A0A8H8T4P7_9AGAM|nr:aldo/keto reductase family protein [Rhizoctonia solani]QRW27628.1 aldo/keto reductase family protein [Rhizoctonia solani]
MSPQSRKKMTYGEFLIRLGNSGLKVSRIILGLMSYGTKEWADWVLEEKEGIEHIKAAYEAGIQTFDTANMYSNGESERILGNAIKQLGLPRDEIVVMTKLCGIVGRTPAEVYWADTSKGDANGYVNQYGLSRKHIFESVKKSLERLQLDYIDVLQCHRFDYNTPIEETMRALHDVVQAGYARYIGMSSCHAYQFHAMQNYAIANKLTPFISVQNHYNLIYREEERDGTNNKDVWGWDDTLVTTCSFSESSLRFDTDPFAKLMGRVRDSNKEIVSRAEKIAKSRGISMAQVSIAWNLSKDYTTAPIIGITNLKNLHDTIDAIDVKLTEEEIRQLEEPYVPRAIIGHA